MGPISLISPIGAVGPERPEGAGLQNGQRPTGRGCREDGDRIKSGIMNKQSSALTHREHNKEAQKHPRTCICQNFFVPLQSQRFQRKSFSTKND